MVDRRHILLLEAFVLLRDAVLPQPLRQIPRTFITAMKLFVSCRAGYENHSGDMSTHAPCLTLQLTVSSKNHTVSIALPSAVNKGR